MSEFAGVRLFLRLMVDPGWAVWLVAIAFLLSVSSGIGDSYDYVFHTAGGAAIAFFAYRTASIAPGLASRIKQSSRPMFAFVTALIVAALWEVAEFAADRLLGTNMQHGPLETLRDFAFGALGALIVCLVFAAKAKRGKPD
jgi:hypothetical protein